MRWKVLKAIGMPPSDHRVRQMNDAQWLWSYLNVLEDENQEEEAWHARLKYLTWFINYEMAKSVAEQEDARKQRNGQDGVNVRESDNKVVRDGVFSSSDFDVETKAAMLGYNPSDEQTPEEFLEEYYKNKQENKEVDIMNDDFDDLVASGEFTTIAQSDDSVGNRFESEGDFLAKVQAFEQEIRSQNQQKIDDSDLPIGLETDDEIEAFRQNQGLMEQLLNDNDYDIEEQRGSSNNKHKNQKLKGFEDMSPEEFKKMLAENNLSEDDLDIFEINEDEEDDNDD